MTIVKGFLGPRDGVPQSHLISATPTAYTLRPVFGTTVIAPCKVSSSTDLNGYFELDLAPYCSYTIMVKDGQEFTINIPDTDSVWLEDLISPIPWRIGWVRVDHTGKLGCVMHEDFFPYKGEKYRRYALVSELTDGTRKRIEDLRDLDIVCAEQPIEIYKEYVRIDSNHPETATIRCEELELDYTDMQFWFDEPEEEDYGEFESRIIRYPSVSIEWF